MRVEVINTGTELLLGDIVNTNFQLITRLLNQHGFNVLYQTTVGDNPERMRQVLLTALSRVEIVIMTGGLGPTRGDITMEVVAEALGLELHEDAPSLAAIEAYFASQKRPMPLNNKKQALLPVGQTVLPNSCGTAPGVAIKLNPDKCVILLPGPPSEMQAMLREGALPYLLSRYAQQGVIISKVLHCVGIGESALAELLDDYIVPQTNPTIALYARQGEIVIRLTAKANSVDEAKALNENLATALKERISKYLVGEDDEPLAKALGAELVRQHKTIACAESCTGGLLTSMLTDVAGSSSYVSGSVVSYTNAVKAKVLGVSAGSLRLYTAVSRCVAGEMAHGVRTLLHTDLGVSITGIAGPGGGSPTQPVGLVYIGVTDGERTVITENHFRGDRAAIKMRSAKTAMVMALNLLKGKE